MEIVKVKQENGEETCFIKCQFHNWFYSGRPPLTVGCQSCWMVYYTGQQAQGGGDKEMSLEILESIIKGLAEKPEGELESLDLKPDIEIKEN